MFKDEFDQVSNQIPSELGHLTFQRCGNNVDMSLNRQWIYYPNLFITFHYTCSFLKCAKSQKFEIQMFRFTSRRVNKKNRLYKLDSDIKSQYCDSNIRILSKSVRDINVYHEWRISFEWVAAATTTTATASIGRSPNNWLKIERYINSRICSAAFIVRQALTIQRQCQLFVRADFTILFACSANDSGLLSSFIGPRKKNQTKNICNGMECFDCATVEQNCCMASGPSGQFNECSCW